jgi:anti-sigma factor ChrR (cupin superfamily)
VNVQERLEVGDRPVDALLAGYAAGTLSVSMAALVTARLELKPADRGFVSALEAAYGVFLEEIEPVVLTDRDRRLADILASANGQSQLRQASLRTALNGKSFNGETFNGETFNGESFNGETFNGETFNGRSHADVIYTGGHYAADLTDTGTEAGPGSALQGGPPSRNSETLPMSLQKFIGCQFKDLQWRAAGSGIKQSIIATDGMEEASLVNWRAGHRTPTHGHLGLEAMLVLKGGFSDGIGEYRRGDISVADESIEHKPIALPGEDCVLFVVREAPVKVLGTMNRVIQMLIGR